jgi:hypothetical protein
VSRGSGWHHTEASKLKVSIANKGKRKIHGICRVDGCGEVRWAKDLCKKHYQLLKRIEYGKDPKYKEKRHRHYERNKEKILLMCKVYRTTPEVRAKEKEKRALLKYEVLSHYSGEQPKCIRCNFTDIRALSLDHIFNDGAEERRRISKNTNSKVSSGSGFYQWVIKNNFPNRYQVLCMNCNLIKHAEFRNGQS